MFDLSKLSTQYHVRPMKDADADALLAFCLQNDQYYRYCGKQPSRELILHDLHITPPNTSAEAKYYVGFYDGDVLVAIMDLGGGCRSCEALLKAAKEAVEKKLLKRRRFMRKLSTSQIWKKSWHTE